MAQAASLCQSLSYRTFVHAHRYMLTAQPVRATVGPTWTLRMPWISYPFDYGDVDHAPLQVGDGHA
jgi:hypothetical protein